VAGLAVAASTTVTTATHPLGQPGGVHPLGHSIGHLSKSIGRLVLGEGAIGDVLGEMSLDLVNQRSDKIVGAHPVRLSDLGEGAARGELAPKGFGVNSEQLGHDLGVSAECAATSLTLTASGQRRSEVLRDRIGLLAVDRRVVDERLQRIPEPLRTGNALVFTVDRADHRGVSGTRQSRHAGSESDGASGH
jgi:hypothetical protein